MFLSEFPRMTCYYIVCVCCAIFFSVFFCSPIWFCANANYVRNSWLTAIVCLCSQVFICFLLRRKMNKIMIFAICRRISWLGTNCRQRSIILISCCMPSHGLGSVRSISLPQRIKWINHHPHEIPVPNYAWSRVLRSILFPLSKRQRRATTQSLLPLITFTCWF